MQATCPSETPVVTRRHIPEYSSFFSSQCHKNVKYHVSLEATYSLQSARRLSWSKEFATSQNCMRRPLTTCILMGQQHVTFCSVALKWTTHITTMSIALSGSRYCCYLFRINQLRTPAGPPTPTEDFLVFHQENASVVYYSTPRPVTPKSITISVDRSSSERYSHSAAHDMARLVWSLKMHCSVQEPPLNRILCQSGPF